MRNWEVEATVKIIELIKRMSELQAENEILKSTNERLFKSLERLIPKQLEQQHEQAKLSTTEYENEKEE